jgi:hypothetical protein
VTVETQAPANGGVSAAEAAALAALIDRYAGAREVQSVAVGAAVLWLWRQFLVLGPGGKPTTPQQARAVAALRTVPARDFARALTRAQLDVLYDEDAVHELAAQLAASSAGAQRQAADLAGEFERQVLQFFDVPTRAKVVGPTVNAPETVTPLLTGPSVSTTSVATPADTSGIATSRMGVDPVEVYMRPAVKYRYERSLDASVEEALADAEARLGRLVEDDVMVAERDAFWDIINGPDESTVTGYRRVLRPEMAKFGSCGLCVAAATRTYSREDLLPLHNGCNCIVLPVMGDKDPGFDLNEDDFKKLYAAAGGTTSGRAKNGKIGLQRVRVTTVEHGELGPILARYGRGYLDQAEADARRRDRADRLAAREAARTAAAAARAARRAT